ncbi:MAG TPA: uroporphyrinogen decarboxylase family protein [Kouleothrix sp.]|uniref:uroporphyrinogen decarboxylase family protein n=1 Tax=Kouleothrix sp. TaxID=2779161 RepID=UPI002C64C222|nr:uroporphyrinogen decarboxylase family protein [Kouleothrix sp.]
MMTKRERLAAALAGEPTDRPLVALWRHFPADDADPEQLALSTLAFQTQYDWDFIKLTPSSEYSVAGWGCRAAYRGHPEGVSEYLERAVTAPADWARLPVLDVYGGALGRCLAAIRTTRQLAGPDIPILATVFGPLAQAKNLVGGGLDLVHLREHRQQFLAGLEVIAETTVRFVVAALEAGADGIFYAVQRASAECMSEAEYLQVGRPLDLHVLEAAQGASFNLLHLHGHHTFFDLVADYPVHALNWHDRETGPSLAEGARRFPGLVVGGLSQQDLVEGSPESVRAQALAAVASLGARPLCLSTGCVAPTVAPWGNMRALRSAAHYG